MPPDRLNASMHIAHSFRFFVSTSKSESDPEKWRNNDS